MTSSYVGDCAHSRKRNRKMCRQTSKPSSRLPSWQMVGPSRGAVHRERSRRERNAWNGCRVSFMTLNAQRLLYGNKGEKVIQLEALLKEQKWPSIVVITEVNGVAGKHDMVDKFGPVISKFYHIRYTFRSVGLDGLSIPIGRRLVGGGVALLVNKRLGVGIREAHIPGVRAEDEKWLDGHLRVWRLDPVMHFGMTGKFKMYALRRPMYVTGAYIPPNDADGWGQRTRDVIFAAIAASDAHIYEMRQSQDVFAVTFEHSNAPDGGCELPLHFVGDGPPTVAYSDSHNSKTQRAEVELSTDGSITLKRRVHAWHRMKRYSTSELAHGISVSLCAARSGKIALAGVMGHRQSTSWTPCKNCAAGVRNANCTKRQCLKMRSCHDQVRVPSELIYKALMSPSGGNDLIRYNTRRIWWSDQIDHAVTSGFFFVHPMAVAPRVDGIACEAVQSTPALRKYVLSKQLLERRADLQRITETTKQIFSADAGPSVANVDAFNAYIVDVLCRAAGPRQQPQTASSNSSVRSAYRIRAVARHALHVALKARKLDSARTINAQLHRSVIKTASKELDRAEHVLEAARAHERARNAARDRLAAPGKMWSDLELAAADKGASPVPLFKLRDGLNDSKHRLVTTNWTEIQSATWSHRKDVYQYRTELGLECENELDDALVSISIFATRMMSRHPEFHSDSFVARAAADALSPLQKIDARRGIVRDLSAARQRYSEELRILNLDRSANLTRGEKVQRLFSVECANLQCDIDSKEVAAVCANFRDVGAGVDGTSPILLKLQTDGIAVEKITSLINEVWRTGVTPSQWCEHRSLLHYKGKASDPHCLDNYRGLGIDQLVLKILSLVMNERLMIFLVATGGLCKSQGGFQRRRGCPEQIFTLAETVRAAAGHGPVNLAFVDIQQAYDSVLHPILWKKCIDRGIDGRFLSTLQAIYHNAVVVLEMAGERLAPMSVECGVMQGNPLSPALFNIYIDDAIRALDEHGDWNGVLAGQPAWGLPLPMVVGDGDIRPLRVDPVTRQQRDFLISLFFADDGVVMEFDVVRLQILLNLLQSKLARVGLLFNIDKTKWMVVAPLNMLGSDDPVKSPVEQNIAYQNLKKTVSQRHQIKINSISIKLVDKFNYLGVMISWRWNWQAAWRAAIGRAHYRVDLMQRGGFQNMGFSLFEQLTYVRGKVDCHFNYVAAVTGSGGTKSSAPWVGAEDVMSRALCVMSGFPFADGDALKAESGTWDRQTRIDMLLLRFWCKMLTAGYDSTTYRAMCLSLNSMNDSRRSDPGRIDASINIIHRQPWAQQLWAALKRFGLATPVRQCCVQEIVCVQIDMSKSGKFVTAPHPLVLDLHSRSYLDGLVRFNMLPMRLASVPRIGQSLVYEEGQNCWTLPPGSLFSDATTRWSPMLKTACYAALKERGNARRQILVRDMLHGVASRADELRYGNFEQSSGLRRWVELKSASYLEPYWYLVDCRLARRLLRVRLDCMPTEDYVRRRPSEKQIKFISTDVRHVPNSISQKYCRIDSRELRACYCCGAIDNVHGVYRAESLEHVLLFCPAYGALRDAVREQISALASSPAAIIIADEVGVLAPSLVPVAHTDDDVLSWLWVVLRLGTGAGPRGNQLFARPPVFASNVIDSRDLAMERAWLKRAAPEFLFNPAVGAVAARWVLALCNNWTNAERQRSEEGASFMTPGASLAFTVCRYVDAVFTRRRAIVRASADFALRSRDASFSALSSFYAPRLRNADFEGDRAGVSLMERRQLGNVAMSPLFSNASLEDGQVTRPPVGGRARVHFANLASIVYFISDIPTLGLLPTPLRCRD
jgi:hypothetical protein